MSLLTKAEGGLEHLLSPLLHDAPGGHLAQSVLADVEHLYTLAQPIVLEIQNDLKSVATSDQSALIEATAKFLNKYEEDAGYLQVMLTQYTALPPSDRWHDLAVFALQKLAPGVDISLLNLAVELAYNILKRSLTTPTAAPTKT